MLFKRGYEKVRETVNKGGKYIRCCQNCDHYFKDKGDREELCQNPNVLEYDMIIQENSVYCLLWKPYTLRNTKKNILFEKSGESAENKKKKFTTRKESSKRIKW